MNETHLVPRLADLRLRPIVSVRPETTLQAAADIMRAHDISSVVVGEPGEPLSILTERDLARGVAENREHDCAVAVLASPHPLTVPADATVMDAATLMLRESVRHLVVTRGNHAVGIVSSRDLLTVLVESVTPSTVFLLLQRVTTETPETWLG